MPSRGPAGQEPGLRRSASGQRRDGKGWRAGVGPYRASQRLIGQNGGRRSLCGSFTACLHLSHRSRGLRRGVLPRAPSASALGVAQQSLDRARQPRSFYRRRAPCPSLSRCRAGRARADPSACSRPRDGGRRAAGDGNKLAPSHSITSSARANRIGVISMSSSLAVLISSRPGSSVRSFSAARARQPSAASLSLPR